MTSRNPCGSRSGRPRARESQSGFPSPHQDAGLLRTEDAALTVLYGLVAFGHIQLRKIDGYKQLPSFLANEWQKVA